MKLISQNNCMFRYLLLLSMLWIAGNLYVQGQAPGYNEEDLGFSPGEILVIESPNPESIETFAIPAFRGALRLGQPRVYYHSKLDRTVLAETGLQRKDLEFKLKEGLTSYFALVYMEAAKNTIDLGKVRAAFLPGPALDNNNAQYAQSVHSFWAITLKGMGAKHLKPDAYARYFCPDQQACLPLHMPRSSGAYQQKIRQAIWGGRQGEFAEMRAFNGFMDSEASHFLKWSEGKIPEEAYMVGRVALGEYDFNAKGFVLKKIKAVSGGPVLIEYRETPENSLFKSNYQPEGQTYSTGILIPMSVEKAEKLTNDLKSRKRSRQLYYVYKVRIEVRFLEAEMENTSFHQMVSYVQVPVSRTIEFFSDDALTEKLFEISN